MNVYPHGQTSIINELKTLANAGVDVHIIAISKARTSDQIRVKHQTEYPVTYLFDSKKTLSVVGFINENLKCFTKHPMTYITTAIRSLRWRGSNFKLACNFANVLDSIKPTLVYVNWSWATCGSVMYACRICQIPFVFSVKGTDIFPPSCNFSLRVNTAQRILTPSKGYAEILEKELNVQKDKIRINPYCLDNKKYFQVKQARTGRLETIRIICVSTLRPVKRLEVLVHCCDILRKKNINFECRIFGEGSDRKKLEALISDLGLTDFVFLVGHVPQVELPEQFEWCDIYVHTSKSESFCFAVVEAQASGRSMVVADAIGGLRQSIQPGETAVMVSVGAPQELAQAVIELANNPEKRLRMGQKGREFVRQNFTYEHFGPRFLKALFD